MKPLSSLLGVHTPGRTRPAELEGPEAEQYPRVPRSNGDVDRGISRRFVVEGALELAGGINTEQATIFGAVKA